MRSRPFAVLPRHVADAAQAVRPRPTRVARRAAGALLVALTMAGSAQAAPPARPTPTGGSWTPMAGRRISSSMSWS